MDNSRHDSSPGLDGFLAAVLGRPNPTETAAFTRVVLGQGDPTSAAAFAATVLREYNFDPNQPRDERGRWTSGGGSADGGTASRTGKIAKATGENSAQDKTARPENVRTIGNPQYSDLSWFVKGAGKPPSAIEKEYGVIKPTIIARARDLPGKDKNTLGVKQAKTIVATGIPDGFLVGSEGAGPCIIALISMPSSTKPGTFDVVASHLQAKDDPGAMWDQIGTFPKGTRVAIAGGDGSDPASNAQMSVTVASLAHKKGVTIDGYFNGNGLWVDNKGNYYAFKTNTKNTRSD